MKTDKSTRAPITVPTKLVAALVVAMGLALHGGVVNAASPGKAKTVTLGAILSLSGLFSTLGPPERDAMQMAVEKINKSGGFEVNGQRYKFRLKVLDDESQFATVGASDYRQLVEVDHVPVLIMAAGTQSYASLFRRAPVPVLNILDSTYPSILSINKHIFLLRSDTPAYVPGAVWYIKHVLHRDRIAFIGSGGDIYSKGIQTWVDKAAKAYGVKMVAQINYPPGTTNFAPFIQKAMAHKPDVIYLGGVTQEVLPVAKQLYQMGIRNLPVVHDAGATPTQAKQIIGASLYNEVMKNNYDFAGTVPQTSKNPATQRFFKKFRARYHKYPDDLTMWAYDAPFVVIHALQHAGTVTNRAKVYRAMLSMKIPPGTISGWIPAKGDKLFHGRDAQTLSEGLRWCQDKKTIAPVFLYFMRGLKVTRKQIVTDGCAEQ